MANKAMKQRHWDRIAGLTGHTFDMESETFSLRNIMEAPLLKHKEDIEVGDCFVCWFVYSIKFTKFGNCRKSASSSPERAGFS